MNTTIRRRPDWPERLHDFLQGRRERPFLWGENDCCLFAADAVLAMTGIDLAEGLRSYSSARDAVAIIEMAGGMEALAVRLTAKKAGFASRGDVVLVDVEGRETFGIVAGNGYWCGPGESGLTFRPMSEVKTVFGV